MLRDQYMIGRALGHGGFGITYLAWDVGLETRLAIKEYMPNGVAGRSVGDTRVLAYSDQTKVEFEYGLERFLEEARVLKKFRDHPNIVSIDTIFRDNGTAYLVMEYLDGMTFEEFLKRRGGKVTVETALRVILPVMDALSAVHGEGILHRDISPDNIHLARNGKVKLIDFGAARNALGQKSRNLSIILKEGYAPEEQYRASGIQGPWTDVYATAATLYHAITGQVPRPSLDRQAEDQLKWPSQMDVVIDPDAEASLMRALAVKASDRFQSMEDFKEALGGGPVAPAAATRKVDRNDPRIRELEQAALLQAAGKISGLQVPPPPPALPQVVIGPGQAMGPTDAPITLGGVPPPAAPIAAQMIRPAIPQPGRQRWMWPAALGGVALVAVVVFMMYTSTPDNNKDKTKDKPGVIDGGGGISGGGTGVGIDKGNGGGGFDNGGGGADKGGTRDGRGTSGGGDRGTGGDGTNRGTGGGQGGDTNRGGGTRTDDGGVAKREVGRSDGGSGGGNGGGGGTSEPDRGRGGEPPSGAETYDGLVQAATKSSQQSNYAQAAQMLNRAVAMDPNNPRAYDKLGELDMYYLNQIGPALQNYQAAIARGGTATFHVAHDHSTGNFTTNCKGLLYVSKTQVRYQALDSVHAFTAPRAQIREFKKNRFTVNLSQRAAVDLKAFHVKLEDGKNWNFEAHQPLRRGGARLDPQHRRNGVSSSGVGLPAPQVCGSNP